MDDNQENIARRIIELYAGSNLPAEIEREVKQWLVSGLRRTEKEEVLWDIWNGLEPLPESGNARALRRVRKQLGMDTGRVFSLKRTLWISAAAIVAVLLLIPGVNRYLGKTVMQEVPVTATVVTAGEAQRRHADISEAAQVWVNSNSELAYYDSAEIELDGEAFFSVRKDAGARLAVSGGELKATVTGTSFNYRSFAEETSTVITLYEGSLLIESPDTTLVLTAGHELIYDRLYHTIDIRVISRTRPEWIRDVINFEGATVRDIFRELENIYGVTIADEGFRGEGDVIELKFEEGIGLDEVMYFMSSITGEFEYTIDGDKVRIKWIIED